MNINSHQFFDLLNEADSSYLAAAHKSMTAKPARMWVRPALIAACLTLILVAIPVGILIGNRTIKPSVPVIDPSITANTVTTTQAPPTTQAPQTTTPPSILNIPGAVLFDEVDWIYSKPGNANTGSPVLPREEQLEWLNQMKENNSIVVGYIKDYTSVLVPDGKDYYHIASMEIQVLDNISGIEAQTIKAVYACKYKYAPYDAYVPQGTYYGTGRIRSSVDQFLQALNCTEAYVGNQGDAAGFMLLKESNDQTILIGDTTYNLSDYADYVLDACLQCDNMCYVALCNYLFWYRANSSVVNEVFNYPFSFPYPCPYEFPFSYPLETPNDSDSAANIPTFPTS